MKQKKCVLLAVIWLLLLPQLLSAQANNPFSKLKPGDWFEMKVNVIVKTDARPYEDNQYLIRYKLISQSVTAHQNFLVTIERIKLKMAMENNIILGYDSYYPDYLQNSNPNSSKLIFQLETDAKGKNTSLKAIGNETLVNLSEITPKMKIGGMAIQRNPIPVYDLAPISQVITYGIKNPDVSRHASVVKFQDGTAEISYHLHAASFAMPKNAVIKGIILNLPDSLRGKITIGKELVNIHKNGSFIMSLPVTKSGPVHIFYYPCSVILKAIDLFVNPGDTITVTADVKLDNRTFQLAGKITADAALGKAISSIYDSQTPDNANNFDNNASISDFITFQEKGKNAFEQIIKAYQNKSSAVAIDYYQTEFRYLQAEAKLYFLSEKKYLATPQSPAAFQDFPKDFFQSIDAMPLLMNNYEESPWYQSYIRKFIWYQSDKMSLTNGGQFGYFSNYAMSLASLKGFPLYYSLSESLENELRNLNWNNVQSLKPYYQDLINNCGDTSLINPIIQRWKSLNLWEPGKISPIKYITLSDGSKFSLEKFKGKTICLTISYHLPDELKELLERIKKYDPKKVHFIIAQAVISGFPKSTIDSAFKALPNVTYLEINNDNDKKQTAFDNRLLNIKTFVIDPEFRIVEDNIYEANKTEADLKIEKAIKKASLPRRIKNEKAALMNIIGWSAGSILFTVIVAMSIYKVRIASIKKREQVKRQIKELEIKAIRSQMNPHFIFNALNSIQSLINNNQYREANIYLEKFAVLMRRVLNNSEKSLVPLSDDLEAILLYCELEKLRFGFSFNLEIDTTINTDLIEIPGMIIQPLVENAIIHGIAQKGTSGTLHIKLGLDGAYLKISVIDNGKGLDKPIESTPIHNGFGLKLVKERLNILNSFGSKGELTLTTNIAPNTGTTAILTIPID